MDSAIYPTGTGSSFIARWINNALTYIRRSDNAVFAAIDGANRLFMIADTVRTERRRFTIAEVNAGATLLAARAGYRYRMVDCRAIAVGGAAAAVTTVDVLATLSSSRKLVAFAQASLTQSAVLTAGGSGAAVLADGASYTANDANTAVTVGKTGSNVTTATHIDVIFDYVMEVA